MFNARGELPEETAARQLQAYQRRSKVDQLTDSEKLQLGMEIETMAANIIANRAR